MSTVISLQNTSGGPLTGGLSLASSFPWPIPPRHWPLPPLRLSTNALLGLQASPTPQPIGPAHLLSPAVGGQAQANCAASSAVTVTVTSGSTIVGPMTSPMTSPMQTNGSSYCKDREAATGKYNIYSGSRFYI